MLSEYQIRAFSQQLSALQYRISNIKYVTNNIVHDTFMFRSVDDDRLNEIIENEGFISPSTSTIYMASKGGIYFSSDIPGVIYNMKNKHQQKASFFVCNAPDIYITLDWSYDLMYVVPQYNMLVRNVRYHRLFFDEYVIRHEAHTYYKPSFLALIELECI